MDYHDYSQECNTVFNILHGNPITALKTCYYYRVKMKPNKTKTNDL